ncbi:RING-H2 finger protein [Aspergillus ibericus CBS 121593]|uniref:RING-type domain-containing protein n=1 Tax=Aspergillus ibericus CBS 121593 TaxID=1448316 RepID=A0A395HB74_9EURO|nr:hypothetical protein BO80DRAFT_283965 [Aspergillus ibericus CBS 121593]RAL03454.1 hypothetical protein BO80DRAFT_283965 [Aspergillus ibericus CBS 121593]
MGPPRSHHPSSSSFFFFLFSFLSATCTLRFLSVFLLLALSPLASAVTTAGWTVRPSNNSADLSWTGGLRFQLNSTQVQLPATVRLAPLTQDLVDLNQAELAAYLVTGSLVDVDATNSLSLNSKEIAVISCDPSAYPGNLDASSTVGNVLTAQQQAVAVILYSGTSLLCNYTTDEPSANRYINVFTLLNPTLDRRVQTQLSAPGNGSTTIGTNMSYIGPTGSTSDTSSGSGDSPNTAMIILYSITGIITALFLAIIITGAVRAHRHPERYGPRYTAGRPRQSRARGIARAMLDTIPIVKFGDTHEGKPEGAKGDVEMGAGVEAPPTEVTENRDATAAEAFVTSPQPPPESQPTTESMAEKRSDAPEAETTTDHPNFSCPICTDDFVKGQDLRVLPCNHQFHPECIDPWLVNVSGTCPLCRIDLNPPQREGEDEHDLGDGHPETSPEGPAEPGAESGHPRHRRLSNYLHGTLNARRMRDASVEERLAALRSVREEANREEPTDESDERLRRRSRLTTRLRERFRVRTRAHGDETEASSSEAPPA